MTKKTLKADPEYFQVNFRVRTYSTNCRVAHGKTVTGVWSGRWCPAFSRTLGGPEY